MFIIGLELPFVGSEVVDCLLFFPFHFGRVYIYVDASLYFILQGHLLTRGLHMC